MKNFYLVITCLVLSVATRAQNIIFSDPMLKSWLLATSTSSTGTVFARDLNDNLFAVDADGDGEISIAEAQQVSYFRLSCSSCLNEYKLTSLDGIENFSNLKTLIVDSNLLTSVDLSELHNLETLYIFNNSLTTFDCNGLTALKNLSIGGNELVDLDFSQSSQLVQLDVSLNLLTSLDAQSLQNLVNLNVSHNHLSTLNLGSLPSLWTLYCNDNQLTAIDFSNTPLIDDVRCMNNQLSVLDFSDSSQLTTLICSNNLLTHLYLKNGGFQNFVEIDGNPTLRYICVDEAENIPFEADNLQYFADLNGYVNCVINSYCAFTPGGNTYQVNGEARLDSGFNGCDDSDMLSPIVFNVSNGENAATFFFSANAPFSISLPEGLHTIAPILANPNYYSVFPTSVVADFPTQGNEVQQNFCITPNGNHIDVESVVIPVGIARPGFDATYKIIYRNNGTVATNGEIQFTFNDDLMDLVSTSSAFVSATANQLVFAYNDLQPFQQRDITLVFNINTPMESLPVNAGDDLGYGSIIFPLSEDENPHDNFGDLKQRVVASLDPNDKTCLEGDVVASEMIAEYVHYMIRFENTGTANAQNIVVKDMIDATKFDIATLVPINGSHPFETRISSGNKVELIFENINLPFDDINNDGYVAFKIKTKPTLVLGDTFSNSASIYFDYNFPVVTNTATTTIQQLQVSDFDFSTYFTLYPNPVANVLNVKSSDEADITSVSIFNDLGQIVLTAVDFSETSAIDVSQLKTGTYFIRVFSSKGSAISQFIKK